MEKSTIPKDVDSIILTFYTIPQCPKARIVQTVIAEELDRHGVVCAGYGAGHLTATELLIVAAEGHLHVVIAFRVVLRTIVVIIIIRVFGDHVIAVMGLQTEDTECKLQQRARRDRERPHLNKDKELGIGK